MCEGDLTFGYLSKLLMLVVPRSITLNTSPVLRCKCHRRDNLQKMQKAGKKLKHCGASLVKLTNLISITTF